LEQSTFFIFIWQKYIFFNLATFFFSYEPAIIETKYFGVTVESYLLNERKKSPCVYLGEIQTCFQLEHHRKYLRLFLGTILIPKSGGDVIRASLSAAVVMSSGLAYQPR